MVEFRHAQPSRNLNSRLNPWAISARCLGGGADCGASAQHHRRPQHLRVFPTDSLAASGRIARLANTSYSLTKAIEH